MCGDAHGRVPHGTLPGAHSAPAAHCNLQQPYGHTQAIHSAAQHLLSYTAPALHCNLQQMRAEEAHARCTRASTTQHSLCYLAALRPLAAACSMLASMRVCVISCPGSPMTVNQRSTRLSVPRHSMSHRLGALRVRLSGKLQGAWREGTCERDPRQREHVRTRLSHSCRSRSS